MAASIKFGTDGWRGIIAQDFTFENVQACAQGFATYLKLAGHTRGGIIVGYDNRFASEEFAAAAAEVLAANGIKVLLCTAATPTPVVSFGVVNQKTDGGIIITASHNPAAYNGFKIKSEMGTSSPPEVTAQVEANLPRTYDGEITLLMLGEAESKGMLRHIDLAPSYNEQVARMVDLSALREAGLNVIIDPMFGAGCGYLPKLLKGGKLKVKEINGERNPSFPGMERPEPIAVNLKRLTAAVKRSRAAVGLAMDGDADRMGVIDENGRYINQLEVFALLCLYLLEVRGERGPIVKAITASNMLYRLGELFKVPVYETPVGFKYVAEVMLEKNALIGGEESGGYGFRGHVIERDGILANLFFLDMMVKTGKTPSQLLDYLFSKVGPHFYHRIDLKFPENQRQAIIDRVKGSVPQRLDGVKVAKMDTLDGFRFTLVDGGWLLIRFSGTEPVLRVYAESDSTERVNRLLEIGENLTGVPVGKA